MASEKVLAARAVPRAIAREFRESKWMTVSCAGLLFMLVMSMVGIAMGMMGGEDALIQVVNAMLTVFVAYAALKMVKLRQGQDAKQAEKASKAYLIYFIVQMIYFVFMACLYFSMHSVMHSGEVAEVTQEVIDQWDALLPYYIFMVVIIALQMCCSCSIWRVLRGVGELSKGRYTEGKAMTAASALFALTTGMLLCSAVLSVMMSSDILTGVTELFTAVPEILYYFGTSQLCRQISLRIKEQQQL